MIAYHDVAVPLFKVSLELNQLIPLNALAERLMGQDPLCLSQSRLTGMDKVREIADRVSRSGVCITRQLHVNFHPENANGIGYFEARISKIPETQSVFLTMIDLSDWEKRRSQESQRSHFLEHLLDLASTLFFVIDREDQIIFANKAFRDLLSNATTQRGPNHVQAGQMKRLSVQDEIGLEDLFFTTLRGCIQQKKPYSIQIRWYLGHEAKIFQMIFQPLSDKAGTTEQALILGTDVTALVMAHEEQAQLQRALNEAKRLNAIGQMAGTIAHDFNGFMTVITSSISLLELEIEDEELLSLLQGVTLACQQAKQLTQDLLAYSRSQMNQITQGDVKELDEYLAFALPRLGRTHVHVHYSSTLEPNIQIPLSVSQCTQILVNLVNNAVEAISENKLGVVQISCHSQDGELIITVDDNGSGIPASVQAEIFEPFFTTKRDKGGTGLGLASTHSLVTRAGGMINVASIQGEGSTFTVMLPYTSIQ